GAEGPARGDPEPRERAPIGLERAGPDDEAPLDVAVPRTLDRDVGQTTDEPGPGRLLGHGRVGRRRAARPARGRDQQQQARKGGLQAASGRGCTLSLTHATICPSEVPGVKRAATPFCLSGSTSSSGMIPPPNTATSVTPRARRASRTAGNSVLCAPDMIESPIASTSSWTAAAAIISGVWCRPV